jgi:small subunit ribosomal protein S5
MVESKEQKGKTEDKSGNRQKEHQKPEFDKESWKPKTKLGELVKKGEIKDMDVVLDNGMKIHEQEIVDVLIPNIESELLLVGQSKGKFGGGQRRVFKQTQKKTREGNKPHFSTFAVVGNKDGYVGIGSGKSKETVPAREKAFRNAKLNLIKIRRGCGSWQCGCKEPHTIPFKVEGKCGSVKITLIPAPKGTGLKVEKECQKVLSLAGVKDIWSRTSGQTKSKNNLIYACEKALRQIMDTKIGQRSIENTGLVEGKVKKGKEEKVEEKKDE